MIFDVLKLCFLITILQIWFSFCIRQSCWAIILRLSSKIYTMLSLRERVLFNVKKFTLSKVKSFIYKRV